MHTRNRCNVTYSRTVKRIFSLLRNVPFAVSQGHSDDKLPLVRGNIPANDADGVLTKISEDTENVVLFYSVFLTVGVKEEKNIFGAVIIRSVPKARVFGSVKCARKHRCIATHRLRCIGIPADVSLSAVGEINSGGAESALLGINGHILYNGTADELRTASGNDITADKSVIAAVKEHTHSAGNCRSGKCKQPSAFFGTDNCQHNDTEAQKQSAAHK